MQKSKKLGAVMFIFRAGAGMSGSEFEKKVEIVRKELKDKLELYIDTPNLADVPALVTPFGVFNSGEFPTACGGDALHKSYA